MTLHLPVTIGMYTVLLIGAGLTIYGWIQVRSFLGSYSSIDSQKDLHEFKRIVKVNMFLALAIMVLCGVAIVLAATGYYLQAFRWADFRLLLFIFGPVCSFAGFKLTSAENDMKSIALNDESLRTEFDHVVTTWNSRALPDW